MTTTVMERNLVSIPPEIAREFDIHPGTRLEWAAADGGIVVHPQRSRAELARKLLGAGRHLLKAGADPIGDLLRERQADDQIEQTNER